MHAPRRPHQAPPAPRAPPHRRGDARDVRRRLAGRRRPGQGRRHEHDDRDERSRRPAPRARATTREARRGGARSDDPQSERRPARQRQLERLERHSSSGDAPAPARAQQGGPVTTVAVMREHARTVEVFGGRVALRGAGREAPLALAVAEALLRRMHAALTRFDPRSELCRLNADPRPTVPASALVRRLAAAVPYAGALSGGLVDATVEPALVPRTYGSGQAIRARRRPIRGADGRRSRSTREAVSRPPGVAARQRRAGQGPRRRPRRRPAARRCPPTRSSAWATSARAAPRARCASRARGTTSVLAELHAAPTARPPRAASRAAAGT